MSVNARTVSPKADGRAARGRAPLPGYLLLAGMHRLRGSQSLKILGEIEDAPYAPPEEVRAGQFRRLSALLAHAEARVPYYRELFRSLGVTSRDVRNLEDFARLPVLTKEIIRERWRDLVREDVALESLSRHHSGGSTGVPLSFYREHVYMDASEAGTFRNFRQSGWRPGEMVAFFWGSNERIQRMSRAEFELRQRVRRMYQFDPFHSGPEEMERWLRRWPTLGATVAHGYASTIARFAEFVEASGRKLRPLRGVFTTAEKLYAPQREVIERVFECHAYDCYGSSEVQNIAAECPRGRMHVNADYVVLETDPAAAPGAPAPLLVTSLWNYAMPFIRYRNGDCGELKEGSCDCSNNFPLMRLNVARTSDNFVMPDGRVVHGEFFTHLMYGSRGIQTFQFHQTAPDQITLWVVPSGEGDREARARTLAEAVAQIKGLTPAPVTVEVRETDSIPLSTAGKHRFTRSDVNNTTAV
jgi:phenylacetate-CoA ligase